MIETFTVEEMNLMCIFNTNSRIALITELKEAMPYFGERELIELADNLLSKLAKMNDVEFNALELFPEYGEGEG